MRPARCPICDNEIPLTDSRRPSAFPFCSQRCRDIDLGRWFNEGYSVPVETERVLREALDEPDEEREDASS